MFVCVWVNACLYTLRVSVYAHASNTAREGMTHTSKQAIFGLCQQLPPLFLNPGNANISSNLKVPWNSLPSSLQRVQKPFCCWGCMGCWLVRRQDGVLVALVAVVWHWWQCWQPIACPRRMEPQVGAGSPRQHCKPPLPLWVSPQLNHISKALQRSGCATSLLKFYKGSSLVRQTHFSGSVHYRGI